MPIAIKKTAAKKRASLTVKQSPSISSHEDLHDLRALNAAIVRNGTKPGIPWAQAKKALGL